MIAPDWLIELSELIARNPDLGIGNDAASMNVSERFQLLVFLRRIEGEREARKLDTRPGSAV